MVPTNGMEAYKVGAYLWLNGLLSLHFLQHGRRFDGLLVMTVYSLPSSWQRIGFFRRAVIISCIVITALVATSHMSTILPYRGITMLERAITVVFGVLFAWISIGFWESMAGLWTLLRGRDRFAVTQTIGEKIPVWGADVRAAVVMPIYNEDVQRVFARIRAIYESVRTTGRLDYFDFFILSDTTDPDTWVAEEVAWADLCASLGAFNRIYYRRRKVNRKRKSGNIADFCRRWGRSYRYMIVLDADSVMTGLSLVKLVGMMEQHPQVGLIQTCPMAVNGETWLARVQQFANHVYSPTFSAGFHFLQLGDSHYWGHNAIIRIAPFMKHCGLPRLSGSPPLGGEILSHDFVEAALMRRAGWEVWLAYDLGGSYEEIPPTIIAELKRDRRWCQGNLQHIRLIFAKGLSPAYRVLFMNGIMAYGSAFLWFILLALSTIEAVTMAFRVPDYFPTEHALFPTWPVWHFKWALTLLATTALLLFVPKVVSLLVIIIKQRRASQFGGVIRLLISAVAEVLFSTFFAPIRMLFHTRFVLLILLGWRVGWDPQQRSDAGIRWQEAFRFLSGGMVLAIMWALVLYIYDRSFFWWNMPVFGPIIVSVPLTVWSSRSSWGGFFRRMGLFLIPQEITPSAELQAVKEAKELAHIDADDIPVSWQQGFVRAVADPRVNALHRSFLRKKKRVSLALMRQRQSLEEKALRGGPDSLSVKEKKELLHDGEVLDRLHRKVWSLSRREHSDLWGVPG